MTRAAFRHLRQRAASPLFDAPRSSLRWSAATWRQHGITWVLMPGVVSHAPIAKRGQKQ